MQTFTLTDLYDHFDNHASHISAKLPDAGPYVSLQDLLDDIQARVKKLEEKTKGDEAK